MIALDVLLLIMIIVCVAYCWMLNRRIQDLHNSRVEFARMIKEFDAAIIKADKAIVDMSSLSSVSSEQIQSAQAIATHAERICTELNMISDMGTTIAERLEKNITAARKFERQEMSTESSNAEQKSSQKDELNAINTRSSDREVEQASYTQNDIGEDEALALHHKNELEAVLKRIVTNKNFEPANLSQASYYDTLRKISVRK